MNKKTVLVTGSSRGIGRAIALAFAKEHYNVVINCVKNKDRLQALCQEIEALGAECLPFVGDVSQMNVVTDLFNAIKNRFGHLDVLINNAGISKIGLLSDMTGEEWNEIVNTNLSSVFYCCHEAIPQMLQTHNGKILNISSVWGNVGASCEVAYSATKGGINGFTKALAKELAPSNIQVNAIACGAIDTEMNQFLDEEERNALIEEIPSCRLGRPEEVAHLTLQICTQNNYLTGQIITLDGGWI
ncbi:3-oxoacyl-[acyl-carrier protein] reductase [Lachnospiraceae bacterium KM106-2]|nr:3-oxoacyl-[acyl-carrier protein] reductase [Lachnospiraceae bacterium KM106-2]